MQDSIIHQRGYAGNLKEKRERDRLKYKQRNNETETGKTNKHAHAQILVNNGLNFSLFFMKNDHFNTFEEDFGVLSLSLTAFGHYILLLKEQCKKCLFLCSLPEIRSYRFPRTQGLNGYRFFIPERKRSIQLENVTNIH